jgi:hypothetical protein
MAHVRAETRQSFLPNLLSFLSETGSPTYAGFACVGVEEPGSSAQAGFASAILPLRFRVRHTQQKILSSILPTERRERNRHSELLG